MTEIEQLKKNLEDYCYFYGSPSGSYVEDGCGFRHGYIARMGNNAKGTISLETIIKISNFTKISIDDLIHKDLSYLRKEKDLRIKKEAIARLQAEIEQLESEEE